MNSNNIKEGLSVVVKYKIVFIPFATHVTVGEVSVLSIFGIDIYERVGSVKRLFGYTWGDNS